MSKGDTFENDILALILNATAIANVAQNATSSPLTNLTLSLAQGDPGETGTQSTSECSYGSYARKLVTRTSSGFTVASGIASLTANCDFASATSGSQTASFFVIGTTTGTGKLMYSGTVTPNITITTGVAPRLVAGSIITED